MYKNESNLSLRCSIAIGFFFFLFFSGEWWHSDSEAGSDDEVDRMEDGGEADPLYDEEEDAQTEAEVEAWRQKEAEMLKMEESRGYHLHHPLEGTGALSPFQRLFKRRQVSSAFAHRARSTFPAKQIITRSSCM